MKELVVFAILFFFLGWACCLYFTPIPIIEEINYTRQMDGLNLRNYNYGEVKNKTIEEDRGGDWVCVNIRDMSFERAFEVCRHEVAHEIFAEYCEDNLNTCLSITDEKEEI